MPADSGFAGLLKILNQHNVAIQLVHARVKHPFAVRRDREAAPAFITRAQVNCGKVFQALAREFKKVNSGRGRAWVDQAYAVAQQGPPMPRSLLEDPDFFAALHWDFPNSLNAEVLAIIEEPPVC